MTEHSKERLETPAAQLDGSVARDPQDPDNPPTERERLEEGEQRGTSAGPFNPDGTSAGAEPPR